jgi:hypothetical protein
MKLIRIALGAEGIAGETRPGPFDSIDCNAQGPAELLIEHESRRILHSLIL